MSQIRTPDAHTTPPLDVCLLVTGSVSYTKSAVEPKACASTRGSRLDGGERGGGPVVVIIPAGSVSQAYRMLSLPEKRPHYPLERCLRDGNLFTERRKKTGIGLPHGDDNTR